MRKNLFKKVLAVVSAATLVLGMSINTFAAEDIDLVLTVDGDVSKTIGTPAVAGSGEVHQYEGAYQMPGVDLSDYHYLAIKYTGDTTGLDSVRFEFANAGGVKWFRQNDQGSLVNASGELAPNPSTTEQTFIVDLDASGVSAAAVVHVHNFIEKGEVNIIEMRYMKTATGAGVSQLDQEQSSEEQSSEEQSSETTATTETTATAETTATTATQATTAAGAAAQATTAATAAGSGATTGDSAATMAMMVTLVAAAAVAVVASSKKANSAE